MNIQQIDIKKIRPATYNPRTIKKETLDRLIAGIREFGLVDPLIVNADYTLIGGHQRLKALSALGWQEVPCVMLDIEKDREKALNIALNKISGQFDDAKLTDLLQQIEVAGYDLQYTGLLDAEIDSLLSPADPPEVTEWELGDLYEPFWLVVRGPLSEVHKIKQAIAAAGADNITVESSL